MDRRKFIRNTMLGMIAVSSPISISAMDSATRALTGSKSLKLSFKPYELKLRHSFNLAKYSRTTTPDVLVQIEWDGIVGYGEASMPPYLGESIESVCKFLSNLDLAQFTDPFRLEEILQYVDSTAPNNRAAKASVDIAMHDLIGKIIGQPAERRKNVFDLVGEKHVVNQAVIDGSDKKALRGKLQAIILVDFLVPVHPAAAVNIDNHR